MDKNSNLYKTLLEIWGEKGLDTTQIIDIYGFAGWNNGRAYAAWIKNPKPKPTGIFKGLWCEFIEYGGWVYQYEVIEFLINKNNIIL